MDKTYTDLIIHPVRMRILQLLILRPLTTQQISDALPGVPTSSIYRHLKLLLDNAVIQVSDTRQVRGVAEKTYSIVMSPRISDPEAFTDFSPEEHLHYFSMFAVSLIQSFGEYIHHTPDPDLIADRAGYTEAMFYASDEDMDRLVTTLNTILVEIAHKDPGEGRRLRKLSTISHPLIEPGPDDV